MGLTLHAQVARFKQAFEKLRQDPQLAHGQVGVCIAEQKTEKLLYQYQGGKGFLPASTQKIATAVTALELLGKDFRYRTQMGYTGAIHQGVLAGDLLILAGGDPTFGSWRYQGHRPEDLLASIVQSLHSHGITEVKGDLRVVEKYTAPFPDGWTWGDIGNYYGAGFWGFNWRENQFDLTLKATEDEVVLAEFNPEVLQVQWVNQAEIGAENEVSIYLAPYGRLGAVFGQVKKNESYTVSGSFPHPARQFLEELKQQLERENIVFHGELLTAMEDQFLDFSPSDFKKIAEITSPPLEEIVYWLLNKSVNLYGEALVKTLSYQQFGTFSTTKGLRILRDFWQQRGIAQSELKMMDGSGLSRQNFVTPSAEVKVLLYASKQPYFKAFYQGLPLINKLKMKSGTINGCKGFTGYVHARSGKKYVFSILVNNYQGKNIEKKLFKVLNLLKN